MAKPIYPNLPQSLNMASPQTRQLCAREAHPKISGIWKWSADCTNYMWAKNLSLKEDPGSEYACIV